MRLQLHVFSICHGLLQIYGKFEFQHLIFRKLGVSPPKSKPLAWHAHAGGLLMASCLWLCHRMTDRQEFSNPDQALSSGGSHLVMLAPESEVLPGQVSSSLFGGLKARGGSVRDLHLHLHAAGPATVAVAVCPEAPVSLHSSISASKLFPKAACQWFVLPKLGEDNVVWGECV